MKLKRVMAGGFVGAIAVGTMVLAGPTAEAATRDSGERPGRLRQRGG